MRPTQRSFPVQGHRESFAEIDVLEGFFLSIEVDVDGIVCGVPVVVALGIFLHVRLIDVCDKI